MCRVILESLSPPVESLLKQHNQEAVDDLVTYVTGYVSGHADSLPAANRLPLSGLCYPPGAASELATSEKQSITGSKASAELTHGNGHNALTRFRKPCRISSPFVALSGQSFRTLQGRWQLTSRGHGVSSCVPKSALVELGWLVCCSGCLHPCWLLIP